MKCRVNKENLCVDNALKKYKPEEIDIFVLCDDNIENAMKVFNYLIKLINDINEDSQDDYINKLLIGVLSYIEFCNKIKFELNESDINSINSIENIYKDFIEKHNKKLNDDIIKNIEKINNKLKDNKLSENERHLLDQNLELKSLVDTYKFQIDELKAKIKSYEDKVSKLETKEKRIDNNNQELNKKLKELKEEVQKLKKQYNELLLEKESLNIINENSIIDLESLKNKIIELNELNTNLNSQITTLENELVEVNNQLNEYKSKEEKQINEEKLDNIVLKKLIEGEWTLYNLYTTLNDEGYSCTKEDVSESIKRIKKYICIDNMGIPITYTVSSPLVETNKNFVIDNVTRTYELIVTADWHLTSEIEFARTLGKVDSLYNYCVDNNINLIVNLGDFLEVKPTGSNFEQYSNNMIILENIIKQFPSDKNIIHAILGGNHDRRMLKLGINPIKYLADNRNDFISLGYDNATISFYSSELIGLHHPNIAGIQIDDYAAVGEEINNYLKEVYKNSNINKKDIFLDIFGHFHLSRFDNSYALVPALMKINGKYPNGALHLKIEFNENNKIDRIIIKNIIPDRSFECLSEHVYQKR